ncbi:murein hydrolase activator EnvC family protein [Desulfuribacillus alkaliarsenatis]|uniref:Uncharacterized protein n=1 Tax=Desulfuribacillus alkaliarsenatis TaxID=766136 RepID=A0A1E5G412_9FIRM|nr:M23 family metallopeptidase [Desulfuribacillus alkaliarsenatis]OEF97826.1 hypothetical protein BHF68_13415 [Desulfuribacillus alkaliarsenatis]
MKEPSDKLNYKHIKRSIFFILAIVLAITLVNPVPSSANDAQLRELQRKMDEIKAQQAASERKTQEIQNDISSVRQQERSTLSQIQQVENEIRQKDAELESLSLQILETETQVEITTIELEQAEQRVADRDSILKSRVRSMYENGKVSYLEVLLGSNSFIDFLNRFEALNLIVDQDHRILKENQMDRELIFAKKLELEQHQFSLETLYAQTEVVKEELSEQGRKQRVQLSALQSDRDQLNRLLAEEEAAQQRLIQELNRTLQQYQRVYRGTGQFGWPLDNMHVTSPYGNRTSPFGTGRVEWHNGVDFRAAVGTPIYAAEDGVVALSGWVRGFGWTVILDHGSGITSLYAHNSELLVKQGQTVKQGHTIARAGASGNVTGPHLHFTIYEDGKDVNPSKYVKW